MSEHPIQGIVKSLSNVDDMLHKEILKLIDKVHELETRISKLERQQLTSAQVNAVNMITPIGIKL